MKKLLKVCVFLAVLLVALIAAAAVAIPMYFDPNDHKDRIIAVVEEKTGRQMTLDGDIGLSVFPWLGLELGAVSLGNAQGFGDQPFAATEQVKVRVQMLPLLRKEVRMDTVTIEGLQLNLARNAQGLGNWEDLVPATGSDTSTVDDGKPPVELAALALGGVDIRKASLSWNDRQANQEYSLREVNLQTGELQADAPVDIELSFNVQSSEPALEGRVELGGSVTADLSGQRYAISDLKLLADLTGNEIPGGKAQIELMANAEADLAKQIVVLNDLTLNTAGTEISGKITASGIQGDSPSVDGNLNIEATDTATLFALIGQSDLAKTLKSFNVDVGVAGDKGKLALAPLQMKAMVGSEQLASGEAEVTLSSRADVDLKQETLTLTGLTVSGLGLDVKGSLAAGAIKTNPRFKGKLDIAPFNLRTLMTQTGQQVPETADPKVLTQISMKTDFEGTTNSLKLSALNAKLDDSTMNGNVAIDNFKAPALDVALKLDAIDADRYLPPKQEDEQPRAASPGAAAGAAAQLPLETLRALNAKGVVTIGKLKIYNLTLTELKLLLNAGNGKITLQPSASLYQGQYQGNINIDATGNVAVVTVNESLSGIEAEPLLKDLSGEAKLRGTGDIAAQLTTRGATTDAMKGALNGKLQFAFRNGAIKGFNLGKTLRSITNLRENRTLSVSDQEETDFAAITGNPVVKNGLVTLDDLSLKNPGLRVSGKGLLADLNTETIDYILAATLSETSKGQGGKDAAELAGIEVPVRISGPLQDPSIRPDLGGIVMKAAEKKLRQKVEDKLGDRLKGVLPGGLLGGDAPATEQPAAPVDAPVSAPDSTAPEPEPAKEPEEQLKDALKDKLKGLL